MNNNQVSITIGIVKNNADPAQHGRLQVYIPTVDSRDFDVESLPWATYVSPFGGITADFKVGRELDEVPGGSSYGFWAIPKNSAQVLCGYIEGNPDVRFWMGCLYQPELNRTLPQSVNPIKTEIDESGLYPQAEIPHYRRHLDEAKLAPEHKHYKTRGGFERSVSHPSNKNRHKPTDDGYAPKPLEPEKTDSQTVSLTTPGRHFISMSDVPDHCRMRFKTTAGNQIILDDTNERIYISTAKGRNWIEIDEGSGKIYFYTASKFSIHSENDLNLYSDENINIVAKKRVNIQSEERGVKIQAHRELSLLSTHSNLNLTASRDLRLVTTNGPSAGPVEESSSCSKPPYSNKAIGLVRNWAEPGGSASSGIYINSAQNIDVRANDGSFKLTSHHNLYIMSIGGSVGVKGTTVGIRAGALKTDVAGSMGSFVVHNGKHPVQSNRDFAGEVASAGKASAVQAESVKPKMVVPMHDDDDGWIRDEDEAVCPTPRNRNYVS